MTDAAIHGTAWRASDRAEAEANNIVAIYTEPGEAVEVAEFRRSTAITHRGAIHARAVLAWVKCKTGCAPAVEVAP